LRLCVNLMLDVAECVHNVCIKVQLNFYLFETTVTFLNEFYF